MAKEQAAARAFWDLQRAISDEFASSEPVAPELRVRNVTQTSVTLEWSALELAKADLRALAIYRNGQRLTTIPNARHNTSTKLSGLELDTEYTFQLVAYTSAGTRSSDVVKVRTHTIQDTSGVCACLGHIEPDSLRDEALAALAQMHAREPSDKIQIETTHFVGTSSAHPHNPHAGPGADFLKAQQLSIPIVTPEWLLACAREKRMVPISNYYLGTPRSMPGQSTAQLVGRGSTSSISQAPAARRSAAVVNDSSAVPRHPPPQEAGMPLSPPAVSSDRQQAFATEEPDAPPADEDNDASTMPDEDDDVHRVSSPPLPAPPAAYTTTSDSPSAAEADLSSVAEPVAALAATQSLETSSSPQQHVVPEPAPVPVPEPASSSIAAAAQEQADIVPASGAEADEESEAEPQPAAAAAPVALAADDIRPEEEEQGPDATLNTTVEDETTALSADGPEKVDDGEAPAPPREDAASATAAVAAQVADEPVQPASDKDAEDEPAIRGSQEGVADDQQDGTVPGEMAPSTDAAAVGSTEEIKLV